MELSRSVIQYLELWKNSAPKKPLVLKGARQVGKTYVLHQFGKKYYRENGAHYHYIDMRSAKEVRSIFRETFDAPQILKLIQFEQKISIDTTRDLVIFDEIQECPEAITSLKYFEQDMKELDIIAAGSHLGLQKNDISFPVGKVSFLSMFPLTFHEFALALDADAYHELSDYNLQGPIPSVLHTRLLSLLQAYFFTGGLPEVVGAYAETGEHAFEERFTTARAIQKELVTGYLSDFTKYSGVINAGHIRHVFEAIPNQLSRAHDESAAKFAFKDVIPNRKGFESIRGPLGWLREARLSIKCPIAKKAFHPLQSYCDENKFKMYLFDIGILNCMLRMPPQTIAGRNAGHFKGFIVENFVAQELFARTNELPVSWHESMSEVEFLLVSGADIIPLEVKSSTKSKRSKSLSAFVDRYTPPRAYKATSQNYGYNSQRNITTIPLYCCGKLFDSLGYDFNYSRVS